MKPIAGSEPGIKWCQELEEYRFEQTRKEVTERYASEARKSVVQKISAATSLIQGGLVGAVFCYFLVSETMLSSLSILMMYLFASTGAFLMSYKQIDSIWTSILFSLIAGVGVTKIGFFPALSDSIFSSLLVGLGGLAFFKGYQQHTLDVCENRPSSSLKWIGAGVLSTLPLGMVGLPVLPVTFLFCVTLWFRFPEIFGRQFSQLTINHRLKRSYLRNNLVSYREPMNSETFLEFYNEQLLQDIMDWKKSAANYKKEARRLGMNQQALVEKASEYNDLEDFSRWFYAKVLILRGMEQNMNPEQIEALRHSDKITKWEQRVSEGQVHKELDDLTESIREEFEYAEDFQRANKEVSA